MLLKDLANISNDLAFQCEKNPFFAAVCKQVMARSVAMVNAFQILLKSFLATLFLQYLVAAKPLLLANFRKIG